MFDSKLNSKEHKLIWGLMVSLVIMLFTALMSGCGGGSSSPIVVPPPPIQEVEYEYRLILMDHIYGGKIDVEIKVPKEEETWYWVRVEYRQFGTTMPWSVVTEGFTLNVTILGAPSGYWMPDLGLTGGQFRVKAAEYRLEFQPPINAHLGTATIKLSVPELGAELFVTVTVIDNKSDDPPPPPPSPTCRESHPVREAIDGFWWDCINGEWENTGEPTNPPPPPSGELHAYGAQGELKDEGTITIDEGNGYELVWKKGNQTISSHDINFDSDLLPNWVWDKDRSEVMTVWWKNPANPDPHEPGNMFVIPGSYQASFCYEECILVTISVTDRERFPFRRLLMNPKYVALLNNKRVKPHPLYPSILVTY